MYSFLKRIMDFTLAGLALIVLLPLFIPIMILLKLSGEGEIFYLQNRVGQHNVFFKIWKFATMLKDSPNLGTGSLTVRDDPRVTIVGKYLRITKINELPQIVNVLIGNMSIVGPRPQMKVDFDLYPEEVQKKVYNFKPGITSIGSIIFRDEEKLMSDTDMPIREFYAQKIMPYKGALELWYQKKASIWNDIMIIFLTAWVIIFPTSDLPYKLFSDIPERPDSLIVK